MKETRTITIRINGYDPAKQEQQLTLINGVLLEKTIEVDFPDGTDWLAKERYFSNIEQDMIDESLTVEHSTTNWREVILSMRPHPRHVPTGDSLGSEPILPWIMSSNGKWIDGVFTWNGNAFASNTHSELKNIYESIKLYCL